VLRAGHIADLAPLLIAATCVSMTLPFVLRQCVGRAPHNAWESDSPHGDLVVLICTFRC